MTHSAFIWTIGLTICLVGIIIKFLELSLLIKKLNLSLTNLFDKQEKIEKTIESVMVQANRLDSKLIKINRSLNMQTIQTDNVLDSKFDVETDLIKNQLELEIHQKSDSIIESNLKNNFLSWDILLTALHFPNDENDSVGFEAFELACKNNSLLQLLQVSEDFLNLLAQDGIYLDDLIIEPPSAEAWLNYIKFDKNQHSKKLNCLGIDQHVEKLKKRAKADAVFRDTALMLMRRFDKVLREKLESAEDHHIFRIAETRSGKAFLISGKISETF